MTDTDDHLVTRTLLCAVIEQAVVDAVEPRYYSDRSKQETNKHRHRDAVNFFYGSLFQDMCDAMNLSGDRIRSEVLRKIEAERLKLTKTISKVSQHLPEPERQALVKRAEGMDLYSLVALRHELKIKNTRGRARASAG